MSITGEDADHPTLAGIPIGDLGGGMFAVMGILAALQARGRKGCGQHVDMLGYMATIHLNQWREPGAAGQCPFRPCALQHLPHGGWVHHRGDFRQFLGQSGRAAGCARTAP